MQKQNITAIKQSIENIKIVVVELTQQKTELELVIDNLRKTEALLTRQLPSDDRIDHLFK